MLNELTVVKAYEGLKAKEFSSVELTTACLKSIQTQDKEINAFISSDKKVAIMAAEKADKQIAEGNQTLLTGIPFSVKDAICTADVRSTGAGKILDSYVPPFDATVIGNIRKQGGVLIGKNNCDTFGHGASNENSMYGSVKNPHDKTKVAGGSSGGSAAAVAADMCMYAVAEDTGGSIRQPASFCGIAGLRPSYGRNSRYGIMPMASSLDTVGPMAKRVDDIAHIMEVMAGHDPKDGTSIHDDVPIYSKQLDKDIKGMKIGIPKEYLEMEGLDPEVEAIFKKNIEQLESLGCELVDVSLPHTKYAIPVYYIIVPSEDSSNLARLDGIRYGTQASHGSLFEAYTKSRAQGFPEEVKRRIMMGTYALSAGYYDAYYRKAQKVRTLISNDFSSVFNDVDAIITPTAPTPAFGLGEKKNDILAMYLADAFVSPAALAGLPALSVPGGSSKEGLPVGLQIIGPRLQEATVLHIGHQFQSL